MMTTNACPLCLDAEETVDHILLNCWMTLKVWNSIISRFGYIWVMPRSIRELYEEWRFYTGSPPQKVKSCGDCPSLPSNGRSEMKGIVDVLKGFLLMPTKLLKGPDFSSLSMDMIIINWKE